MPNIAHFAIQADDPLRAQAFYGRVFGWRFEAWGPPDFWNIHTGTESDPGIQGALDRRPGAAPAGPAVAAFICTISVDDIDATARLIEASGGTITIGRFTIPGVGTMVQFLDTEGNTVSAMQYEQGH